MMKQLAILLILGFSMGTADAQITSISVNKANFEKSSIPFKGKRVLQVEHITTANEDNFIVFSKEQRNADPDHLYIQQFQKNNDKWTVVAEDHVSEKDIVTSVWDARKAFFDADKDGKLDAIFVYSRHPKGDMDKQLSCIALVLYNKQFYRLQADQADGYQKTTYSDNYSQLPEVIKTQVGQFWEKLDKD
ncbi:MULTISPECIES: hypothetical protein [Sphingobacterium]|uniref:Uncharacterized protein n=1 Tax=Sphingobacterium kitahiroshimense TaxID=470446 RepID=A0ABV0BVX8_9SPHI|nr:hypothetical protein [Sphingobacterium sp. JUb56]MBB2950244.1 TRAP-type uncharacterized transport system substrate-binding protein [Sphingobacterium sp. JUb56]